MKSLLRAWHRATDFPFFLLNLPLEVDTQLLSHFKDEETEAQN